MLQRHKIIIFRQEDFIHSLTKKLQAGAVALAMRHNLHSHQRIRYTT